MQQTNQKITNLEKLKNILLYVFRNFPEKHKRLQQQAVYTMLFVAFFWVKTLLSILNGVPPASALEQIKGTLVSVSTYRSRMTFQVNTGNKTLNFEYTSAFLPKMKTNIGKPIVVWALNTMSMQGSAQEVGQIDLNGERLFDYNQSIGTRESFQTLFWWLLIVLTWILYWLYKMFLKYEMPIKEVQ